MISNFLSISEDCYLRLSRYLYVAPLLAIFPAFLTLWRTLLFIATTHSLSLPTTYGLFRYHSWLYVQTSSCNRRVFIGILSDAPWHAMEDWGLRLARGCFYKAIASGVFRLGSNTTSHYRSNCEYVLLPDQHTPYASTVHLGTGF